MKMLKIKEENMMDVPLTELCEKIKVQYKITFISTLVFGVISQGMGLFNKYSYHDDIKYLFGVGNTYTLGRWMLEVFSRLEVLLFGDGHFSLPLINGMMAIIFIAMAACFVVATLEIESQVLCIFIGGIMVVFPVVTGIFGYMFCLPYYMMAMMMGVMGAYFLCKKRTWWKAIGIILMGVSVGVYQAFVPLTLCVLLFYMISELAEGNAAPLRYVKKIIAIGLAVIAFMTIYFGMNKIFLVKYNAHLSSYQGIDHMGITSLSGYIDRVVYAYKEFFDPTVDARYYVYRSNIRNIYMVVIILSIVSAMLTIIKVSRKNKVNACMLCGMFLLVPLASNFIFVMASPPVVHVLMVYAQLMPFILFAWLLDRFEIKIERITKIIKVCLSTILIFLNIMYCRFDNQCYLKAEFTQQETISYFTTLITQIKCVDGYTDEMPISFINERKISDLSIYEMENLCWIQTDPYSGMSTYINDHAWIGFMERWCGYSPDIVDGADIVDNEEIKNMPSYPDAGSIKVIEDRIVVKFD